MHRKSHIQAGSWIAWVVLVAVSVLLALPLQAQTTNGSIVGAVTDASGAVVPGATVSVTNLGTSETKTVKSDASGNFSVTNLLPANYKVQVEKANFKRYVRQPIAVEVGATVRTDVALQVGAASETVEVTTQTPLLQTESSSVSQEVEGQTVTEMPLNGRNSMNLIALAAGVVPQGSTQGSAGGNQGVGHTMVGGWNNYQIGGTLAGLSATYVDGAPVNYLGGGGIGNATSLIPTQDSVQEFNVTSNNVTADFGRFGGGIVNMASKGGTNKINGSVYEYIRNSFFNANDWWNKRDELLAGTRNKPVQWNQNQYGASIGGPIKKDKLFYHFTWEGFQSDTGVVQPTNVPTQNMQNGVLSYAITDPLAPGDGCVITPNAITGTWTITNLWTGTCGDPLAKAMRGYYPLPNFSSPQYNYTAVPATPDKQNQYNGRVDYVLSSKQRLFARYTYWGLADKGYSEFGDYGGWKTEFAHSANYTQQFVLGDTYTFSNNTILDVHLAYLRDYSPSSQVASNGMSYSVYPSNSYLNNSTIVNEMTAHVLAQFSIGGGGPPGSGGGGGGAHNYNLFGLGRCCVNGTDWYNTYTLSASLIHIIGKHSLKIGLEARQMSDTGAQSGSSGSFTFAGNFTGDEWADFLLGYEQGGGSSSLQDQSEVGAYNYYQAYYITDAWQATRNLTLNLGLRWELPGGVFAKKDTNTVLLPTATDPTYNTPGTLAYVNSALYPSRSALDIKHDLFSPRVGFSYRLGVNSVVSGGYGISYLPVDTSTGSFPSQSPVVQTTTTCGPSSGNATTPLTTQLMYNCFNANNQIIAPPGRTLPSGQTLIQYLGYYNNTSGRGFGGALPNQKFPYVEQWNLAVSRQFKGNVMLALTYAGSAGIHAPALGSNLNQLRDGSWNASGVLTTGPYAGVSLNDTSVNRCGLASSGFPGPLSAGQCSRPFPHYGNMSDSLAYNAQTIYHSMQFKGEKRFGSGGTLMGNFTWSKLLGDTDSGEGWLESGTQGPNSFGGGSGNIQDYDNTRAERAVLTYDVPYRAVISYVLNLPFGKGQRFGRDTSGVVSHVISGWGVNGITTFQKGFHVPINGGTINGGPFANNGLNSFGVGQIRPNYTAGCTKTVGGSVDSRLLGWFNTKCFTAPANYAWGTEPREDGSIFAEGIDNFDFSVAKSTSVTEKINAQFRAEIFNLFNRKQFATPDANLQSQTFGDILGDQNQPRLVQFSLRINF